MAKKKIFVYYYYPQKYINKKYKLVNLTQLFEELSGINQKERILDQKDGNIQLKKIKFYETKKRWELSFLRNSTDTRFKTKLDDDTSTAEVLDDDEYIGSECCAIYDEKSGILAIQNNRNSVSFNGISNFFNEYLEDEDIFLSPITYKEEFCNISDDDFINYKSFMVGFTDISLFSQIAEREDNQAISWITKIAKDLSAVNGKIEFGVGRKKKFLSKENLKYLVECFRKNNGVISSLKVKRATEDSIRIIDLLSNKVYDPIEIVVTKDDPKTFDKILYQMDCAFSNALENTFNNCNIFLDE